MWKKELSEFQSSIKEGRHMSFLRKSLPRVVSRGLGWRSRVGVKMPRVTYRSTGYSGNLRGRAMGNLAAAKRGKDCAETVIQGMLNIPVQVNTTNSANYSNGNVVAVSIWQLLFNSEYWGSMAKLWDQVKITGFQCKILGNSAASTVLASGLSSVGVLVAIDRNGIDGQPIPPAWKNGDKVGTKRGAYIAILSGDTQQNVNNALSYGSCKTKNWSPGNAFIQWASCYPSTMMEKEPWLNVDDAAPTLAKLTANDGSTTYRVGYPNGFNARSLENMQGNKMSFQTFGFDPVLLLGVFNIPTVSTSTATVQVFTFSMEFKIATVWRGPRGQKSDISENINMPAPNPEPEELNLEYRENTDPEGETYTGLFRKVNVKVNVPVSEEVPTELNHTFTEDTTGEGWIQEGLFNKVAIQVKTKPSINMFTVTGLGGGRLSLRSYGSWVARDEPSITVLGGGGFLIAIARDDVWNRWVIKFILNTTSTPIEYSVDNDFEREWIVKTNDVAEIGDKGGVLLSFYENGSSSVSLLGLYEFDGTDDKRNEMRVSMNLVDIPVLNDA